ncbi:hypothetical protein BHUM_05407c [Candidatus Burkholderia humilis]|nr:hypothetical protein BHUM_05407c [Candidatus Burkholderia humilis]
MRRVGNFTLFFGAEDAFSNWHPCRFEVHGVRFTSVEQMMMFSKAKLFDDDAIAQAVLDTHLCRSYARAPRGLAWKPRLIARSNAGASTRP